MEIIAQAPEVNSFVPLIEHQSATPASFYSGPPVLHYHSQRCKILVLEGDVAKSAEIQRLAQDGEKLNTTNGNGSNGAVTEELPAAEDGLAQRIVNDIDVWVTSESVSEHSLE
jgi:chloride channel, nucleotide-sensitive, 1A